MICRKIFVLLVGVCLAASVQAQAAVDQLVSLLKQMHSYQADFKQTAYTYAGAAQISTGEVMFVRPGQFRWQVKQPNAQLIVVNKNTVWIYDPDLEQATKQKVDNSTDEITPAHVLSADVKSLAKKFAVKHIGDAKSLVFSLRPIKGGAAFQSLQLTFNGKSKPATLKSMMVMNNLGRKSLYSFSRIQLNHSIAAKQFQFVPGKGVDVMDGNMS